MARGTSDTDDTGSTAKPVEIRVIEEAPATNASSLPERKDEVEPPAPNLDDPEPVVGGNTFGNAVDIEPGAYSGTVVPGEAQIFQIDADWGQYVNAAVQFPPPAGALGDVLAETNPQATLWIYSPSRADASSAFHSSVQTGLNLTAGAELNGHSYPINYRHRSSFVDAQEAASLAGKYYIVVGVGKESDSDPSVEIPFTLGASIEGEVEDTPAYDGGGPTIGEVETSEGDDGSAGGASDATEATGSGGTPGSDVPWLPIGLGIGGAALLGLGALAVRSARSRIG